MTASRDPDRLIRAFLHDGEDQLTDQVYDAVRAAIDMKRQRAVIGPWRTPTMNRFITFGLGAAAALIIGLLLGAQLLGEPRGFGGPSEATPTLEPSLTPTAPPEPTPTPTALPEPTPTPVPVPPLTGTFTSAEHGISLSYPEGWTTRPATEPWTDRPGEAWFVHPGFDVLYDPVRNGELALWITSRPIGDAAPEDWLAQTLAGEGCTATEPITVDGATGLIGVEGCRELAAVTIAGRGYEIGLYTPDSNEGRENPSYDRAWFEEVLATVQLHPEDALD